MTSIDSRSRIDAALVLLRVVIGAVFVAHGAQKLFVFGFTGVSGFFGSLGVPAPTLMGPFIAILEFVGGIALVLGLLTRVVAGLIACDMLGAIAIVHFKNGFFLPKGFEFVLVLCVANLVLLLAGGGAYSLDALIGARRARRAVG